MMKLFQDYFKEREIRRDLCAFYAEAKQNLEAYYVMFQLNRLRFFQMQAWEKVRDLNAWGPSVREYAERITTYNQAQKDYRDYEQWYNENLDNKNQENGRILHSKKEIAQAKFNGLEAIIKAAVAAIEGDLVQKRVLRNPVSAAH
jgi:hypothetical protein